MRRRVLVLLAAALTLAAVALALRQSPERAGPLPRAGPGTGDVPAASTLPSTPERGTARADAAALARAREMLAAVQARGGEPLAGYVGGRTFHNRERRLPPGQYREYDVHPRIPDRDRGPERLVVDQVTGRAYYTGDHYRTFVPLN
jgi:ribonuclease T1